MNHQKKFLLPFIIVMMANLCVLNVSKAGTPYTPNSAPSFSGGTTQSLSLCQNASPTAINTLLSVNDVDAGQTETWSVTAAPSHGSLSASYSTTSTGSMLTPTGLTYTPTNGYSGSDAFTVQISDGITTATTTINVTVNGLPTITLGSNPSVCNGTTSANLTYSATTGSPNQYSIAWSAGGIIAGYSNVSLTSLPASPVSLTVPSNPGAGSYTGTLTVKNTTTGCSSTGSTMGVTVNALPTITLGSNPSVCNGTTSANLTYSATTGSPNQYSIAWSAGGIIAGYSNVSLTSLPASPVSLTVPSNPGAGSYTGTLTVKNNTTGCSSTGSTMGVTVNALPTITLGSNPSVCNGTTSANLTYSATTSSPNQYSIAWSAGGIIAGYSNVSLTSLPASPVSLTVPSNPGAGSYTGTLTVKNTTTGCSSTGSTMGVTVNALPTITLGSNPSVCNGTTSANLTYSATTSSPNQYSIAWSAGAIIAGYSNVSLTSLPASPVSLTVPSNPGAGSYTGTLTVKNSTTGCSSTGSTTGVTVNALPTITLGSNPSIINGTTSANLTYSATTSSPNQYSIAWSAGGIIAGFSNVSLTSLPASPISLTVPSSPGAGSYTGTLTVKNTTTGCSSTGSTMGVTVTANTAPVYTGGSTQSLSVCQDAGATAINTLLTVSDVSAGQTETWTVTSGPSHGSLGGFSTTAGSGSTSITPTGLTYTPTTGYNGADAFTIQVSDGIATASKTINVTVNALTVITSSQTQTQDVANASGNYTDGSCNIISNVQPSGGNPVSGNITAVIWVESSVPTYGGKPFVARHYEITPATNATTATGTVTLYFLQSEFDAFNAAPGSTLKLPTGSGDATGIANLRIGKYSGTSSDESGLPGSYSNGAIVIDPVDANVVWNATAARWEVTFNVAGFSGFIAQTSSFVLPVTWVSFTAAKQNENTLLKWQTTAETNSDHFVIEYSTDGHHFTTIGTVAAAGNSNYLINYSFVHNAPQKENNYYRIVQVDHDGHKNYSVIRMIRFNTSGSLLLLMNPVRDGQLQVQFNKAVNMAIFDARGRLITRQQKGAGSQAINVSTLPRGVYLLQAGSETRKFIIE